MGKSKIIYEEASKKRPTLGNKFRKMLINVLRVLVKNLIKESFYRKKKKQLMF